MTFKERLEQLRKELTDSEEAYLKAYKKYDAKPKCFIEDDILYKLEKTRKDWEYTSKQYLRFSNSIRVNNRNPDNEILDFNEMYN